MWVEDFGEVDPDVVESRDEVFVKAAGGDDLEDSFISIELKGISDPSDDEADDEVRDEFFEGGEVGFEVFVGDLPLRGEKEDGRPDDEAGLAHESAGEEEEGEGVVEFGWLMADEARPEAKAEEGENGGEGVFSFGKPCP